MPVRIGMHQKGAGVKQKGLMWEIKMSKSFRQIESEIKALHKELKSAKEDRNERERKKARERMTEADATKSYTHSRPRPSNDPPAEKPKPPKPPQDSKRPKKPSDFGLNEKIDVFDSLYSYVFNMVKDTIDSQRTPKDAKQYLFEKVMETFMGDGVWDIWNRYQ